MLFTKAENQRRMERFKSALNLYWISAYRDGFFEDGGSLLEMESKFLAERNGVVVKQSFGPCTTKDLFDAVSVVATDLLSDALDRYSGGALVHPSFGSSDVAGLRSGREYMRTSTSTALTRMSEQLGGQTNVAREKLTGIRQRRTTYEPTRTQSIRARGMPRAGRGRW